jgi:hypothetical protein
MSNLFAPELERILDSIIRTSWPSRKGSVSLGLAARMRSLINPVSIKERYETDVHRSPRSLGPAWSDADRRIDYTRVSPGWARAWGDNGRARHKAWNSPVVTIEVMVNSLYLPDFSHSCADMPSRNQTATKPYEHDEIRSIALGGSGVPGPVVCWTGWCASSRTGRVPEA